MISRRDWFRFAAGGAAIALTGGELWAARVAPAITVYKSPTCGCCQKWLDHLTEAGFGVTAHDVADVAPIKKKHGLPERLASCHTGLVDGYVVEGHVPADLVLRLIKERPNALGLAVPGMPMGSPGMEGSRKDPYDVLLVTKSGETRVFASR